MFRPGRTSAKDQKATLHDTGASGAPDGEAGTASLTMIHLDDTFNRLYREPFDEIGDESCED
jgi:hypothetical protein